MKVIDVTDSSRLVGGLLRVDECTQPLQRALAASATPNYGFWRTRRSVPDGGRDDEQLRAVWFSSFHVDWPRGRFASPVLYIRALHQSYLPVEVRQCGRRLRIP